MHAQLGNHQRALAYCQEALTLHHERGDRGRYVAAIYDSLGYVHHQLGHHEQAVSWYLEAVRLRHDLGEPYYEARSLTHLGDAHVAAGDTGAAHHAWQQALVILDQLDHPDAEQLRAKLRDGAGDHEPWKV